MEQQIWTTENQLKFEKAFRFAAKERAVVAIADFSGTGFKHALQKYCFYNSDIRSVFVRIPMKPRSGDLGVTMFRQLMSIRFNNFKYTQPSVFDLLRVLGSRVKQDLKGKRILIVFEDVHYFSEKRLSDFMRLIREINFPCGVVLRFEQSYYEKVAKWSERVNNDFQILTKWRQVTVRNRPQDIAMLCQLYGLHNPTLVNQISKQTTSFTIAMQFIKSHSNYRPTTQLNLFAENRLRM